MRRAVVFVVLICAFVFFWNAFEKYKAGTHIPLVMPPPLPAAALKIVSLGHDQAAAQSLFFKSMFYNEFRAEKDKLPPDLDTTFLFLDTATQLDPYNMDAYYYGQALFSDQAQYVGEFNTILERGVAARYWDHYMPWFVGVNYYFTLGDKKKAGEYFVETAKRKPDIPLFATLASRAFHEGNETEIAVLVLQEMLTNAISPLVADKLKVRLTAFETVLFIEKGLKDFKVRYDRKAESLDDLISGGIFKQIPPDPYGGEFYLTHDGQVQTTSQFAFSKEKK